MLAILVLLLLLSFSGLWLTFSDVLPSLFLLKSSFPSSKHLVLIKNTRHLSVKVSRKSHKILSLTETGLCPSIQNRREAWSCLKEVYCYLKMKWVKWHQQRENLSVFFWPTHSIWSSKGELLSQEAMQGHSANGWSPAMPKSLFFLNNSTLPSNKTRLVPSGKLPGKIDQQKSDVFLNLGTWNISL